jgi:tetratricopeptide (TPR) repeat protein
MKRAVAIARNPRSWGIALALVALALVCGAVAGWLADRSTSPVIRLDRARDLAFAHRPEAALREARRALAELADNGDAALRLEALSRAAQITDFQLSDAHIQEALAFYKRIEAEFPGTQQAFDAGVRISEILRQRLHDELHAELQLVAVVSAFPKQLGVEKYLVRAARIAIDNRRFDEAKTYATRVVLEYPESDQDPEAQFLIGESLHLVGRHPEAVKAYEVVSFRWPRTELAARALFEAGNCLAEDGDLTHAIARYLECLPDHPDPMSVQRNLERVRKRFTAMRLSAVPITKEAAFDYRRFSHGER